MVRCVCPDKKQAWVAPGGFGQGLFRDIDSHALTRSWGGPSDLIQEKSIATADVQNALTGVSLRAIARYDLCQFQECGQLMHANPRLNHQLIIPDLLIVTLPVQKAQVTFL